MAIKLFFSGLVQQLIIANVMQLIFMFFGVTNYFYFFLLLYALWSITVAKALEKHAWKSAISGFISAAILTYVYSLKTASFVLFLMLFSMIILSIFVKSIVRRKMLEMSERFIEETWNGLDAETQNTLNNIANKIEISPLDDFDDIMKKVEDAIDDEDN